MGTFDWDRTRTARTSRSAHPCPLRAPTQWGPPRRAAVGCGPPRGGCRPLALGTVPRRARLQARRPASATPCCCRLPAWAQQRRLPSHRSSTGPNFKFMLGRHVTAVWCHRATRSDRPQSPSAHLQRCLQQQSFCFLPPVTTPMLLAGEVTLLQRRSAPSPRSIHARSAACVTVCGAARRHRQRVVRPQRSSETLAPHAATEAPLAPPSALVEEQRLRLELALAVETMGERIVDPELLRSTPKQRCVVLTTTGGSSESPPFSRLPDH